MDDFVAIITSMAARIYGRRNSKRRAEHMRACVEHACVEHACVEHACVEHVMHDEDA